MSLEARLLPPGWHWARLGDVLHEAQAGFACGERDPQGVIQLRMNNVDTRGNMFFGDFIRVPAARETIELYSLKRGDVLFNNTNSTDLVGKTALFSGHNEPVVYSNHFTRLRVNDEVALPEFVSAWLIQLWNQRVFANICNRWIGQSAVKNDKLLNLEIPLPPLAGQRRIVQVLQEQMAAVECARTAAEEQLKAAELVGQAYLEELFRRIQDSPIRLVRLGDIAETCSGTTPPRGLSAYYSGTIPWVKTGELKDGEIFDTEEHVTPSALKDTSLRLLPSGTLLIAMYGQGQTRGRTGLLRVSGTTNQACFAVLPSNAALSTEYLQFWFRHNYERLRRESEFRGGNQPNLNGEYLKAQVVPVPSREEQERLVAAYRTHALKVTRLLQNCREAVTAIDALPAALLRRAFAGEL